MSDIIEDGSPSRTEIDETVRRLHAKILSRGHAVTLNQVARLDSRSRLEMEESFSRLEASEQRLKELEAESQEFESELQQSLVQMREAYIAFESLHGLRIAQRMLPRGVRDSSFRPYFEELLSQFVEDVGLCSTSADVRRRSREFLREVRRAIVLTWWALARDASTRSIRWIAVALLGDGAVRVVYWAFTEVLRRL